MTSYVKVINEDIKGMLTLPLPWHTLKSKTVLVSGATGFIAAYIVNFLLGLNDEFGLNISVVALVRSDDKAKSRYAHITKRDDVTFIVQDVSTPINCKADIAIHAASPANSTDIAIDPANVIDANIVGLKNVLDCVSDGRCILISSGQVYAGMVNSEPIKEEYANTLKQNLFDAKNLYTVAKSIAEVYGASYSKKNNIDFKVVRLFSVYGPGDNLHSGRCYCDFALDILNNRPTNMKGSGESLRNICYVADAITAIFTVLLKGENTVYNVGSNNNLSIKQLSKEFNKFLIGYNTQDTKSDKQNSDSYIPDITRLCNLGWQPRYDIHSCIGRTLESAKDIVTKPIVLYGAGFAGVMVYRSLLQCGIKPTCFADSKKHGGVLEGIPIIEPKEILPGSKIIVCMYTMGEVFDTIKAMLGGLGHSDVVHLFELRDDDMLMQSHPFPIFISAEYIKQNQKNYDALYNLLEDTQSKSTLKDILNFISQCPPAQMSALPIAEQYLAYDDVYTKIDNEVFIDCGAFVGEVFDSFYNLNNGKYKAYVAYEPEKNSFSRLKANTDGHNIKIYNVGLSDKQEDIAFENIAAANAIMTNKKLPKTSCFTLDEVLNYAPTIIKIDVEGYEQKVLLGAENLIKKHRPIVAVAVYHNREDMWQIPLWLNSVLPGYKFYLRSYMNYLETICYAVPPNRIIKHEA